MPVCAASPTPSLKVRDEAELLTQEEEHTLATKINKISSKYQIDIVLATEYDKTASTIQDEADLIYDNNGYGIGENRDGILFLVAKNPGEWAISTSGNAISMFSDYDLECLGGSAASRYFSGGDFYQGFDLYLSSLEETLDRTQNADTQTANASKDVNNKEQTSKPTSSHKETDTEIEETSQKSKNHLVPALIAGFIITVITMSVMTSGMKTANMQNNANAYKQPDAASRIQKKDVFLTTNITKRPIPKDPPQNTSSKTKTTVHRSSSGRTHGGSSGSF